MEIVEPMESQLAAKFESFAATPYARGVLPGLEAALDALYALASEGGAGQILRLEALLADYAGRHPAIDAWLALAGLHLSESAVREPALAVVDAALAGAPAWTRLLVGVEAARLLWRRDGGAVPAWRRLVAVGAGAAFEAALPLDDLRRESPLLISAVCTALDLAALNGAWEAQAELALAALAMWPAHHPRAVRVALLVADAAILQGRYREALQRLQQIREADARGDLRLHLFCTRLHTLVLLGKGNEPEAQGAFKAFCDAQPAAEPEYALGEDDRRALRARVASCVASVKELRHLAEDTGFSSAPVESAEEALATTLPRLLQREQGARRVKNVEKRVRALLSVLQEAEGLMTRDESAASPEGWIRLRLLWCRVLVDLMMHEVFEVCEQMLDGLIEEAHRLGFTPLAMLALDQRAVLRSRKSPVDWKGALLDSSAAAQLAVKQLAENADPAGSDEGNERSLLESLLPVLDRTIDLHAEGAVRIAQRHPTLLERPLGKIDAELLEEDSPRGSWLRFGRALHGYAEQGQALALEEARRAYEDGRTLPRRLAVTSAEEPSSVVDRLREALRPGDGVLQYFVVSRHVLVFVYGRDFFDWYISVVEENESAEGALVELIGELRPWIQGEGAPQHARNVGALEALLLPEKISAALRDARVRHLRIVPHAALYRVPFGRLAPDSVPLLHRFSLSLHPTGQLAAESARARPFAPGRRPQLGYVVGPENEAAAPGARPVPVSCAEREEKALRQGVGGLAPIAAVERIDGVLLSLKEVVTRMSQFSLLHFTCHGREGGEHGQKPSMTLGSEGDAGLEPGAILAVDLHGCALVFLQSCSTGWMDHQRSNPVQGFPQAFCDAGAGAVVAPLTRVPKALAPIFSSVFYRALRFLPAERALQRALEVLRAHGGALVAADPEAREAFIEHGSTMDGFEYRYTGATGLALGGHVSRGIGRLSFWWFEWRLGQPRRRAWAARGDQ